jgi:hypothetical protein
VAWFFLCIFLTYTKILPVANVAHGAGAVIGWLFGRAVLARRQVVATTAVSLLCIALALLTLYMPWDWRYLWHQGNKAFDAHDYAQALSLYERANRLHPGDDGLEHNIDLTRFRLEVEQKRGE